MMDAKKMTELPDELAEGVAGGMGFDIDEGPGNWIDGKPILVSPKASWCPYCMQRLDDTDNYACNPGSPYELFWCYEKGRPYAVRK